jgi:diaminopimelate epimerase
LADSLRFTKYHGLGNDYLVLEPGDLPGPVSPALIRFICDRHYGVGSDGILLGPLASNLAAYGLQIYNPDGSAAEKSGNGLRIFTRYLWERGLVGMEPFRVETPGGIVTCRVMPGGDSVEVEMGRASFDSRVIPVSGPPRKVIDECFQIGEQKFRFCALSLGNPHCVVLVENLDPDLAHDYGPLIENHRLFPQRTNVQFMQVIDPDQIRIEIWERGAGYTLASGSSSCAAARAAQVLGLCHERVSVHMPGGVLQVRLNPEEILVLTGPVQRVMEGVLDLQGLRQRAF